MFLKKDHSGDFALYNVTYIYEIAVLNVSE